MMFSPDPEFDERLKTILFEYHKAGKTNNNDIAARLKSEHNISISYVLIIICAPHPY